MPIDFATLKLLLPALVKCRKPILLRGRHGIGKSELAKWMAPYVSEWLEKDHGVYPIVERRASQMADAGDLVGLPYKESGATAFSPMAWFKQACDEPVILFLDEVDRASTDVRQGIFELTDSRKIQGQYLHPDTIVVACVNGGEDGSDYQVGEMDPAELSRWTVFDLRPTVEDWLLWAKENVNSYVYEFIKRNPGMLENPAGASFEPNKVYPSRRSWSRFSECVEFTSFLTRNAADFGSALLIHLAAGFVGRDAAISFHDFASKFETQTSIFDIMDNGINNEQVGAFEISQHMALISQFEDSDYSKNNLPLSQNQIDHLALYFQLIPPELAMKFWEVISANSENGILFYKSNPEGGTGPVKEYLARINGA